MLEMDNLYWGLKIYYTQTFHNKRSYVDRLIVFSPLSLYLFLQTASNKMFMQHM